MYYPDLSPYEYLPYNRGINKVSILLNISWLDAKHSYPQGNTPAEFLERLWRFREMTINATSGYHECELCENPSFGVRVKHGDKKFSLGSAEIRIVSPTGVVYAAPDLIFHYIIEHKYLPPAEFIEAVMYGPLPSTPEYRAIVKIDFA